MEIIGLRKLEKTDEFQVLPYVHNTHKLCLRVCMPLFEQQPSATISITPLLTQIEKAS